MNPYHCVPANPPQIPGPPFNRTDPYDDPFTVNTPSTPVDGQFHNQNSYQSLPGRPVGMNSGFGHPGHLEFDRMTPSQGRMTPSQGGYLGSYHGGMDTPSAFHAPLGHRPFPQNGDPGSRAHSVDRRGSTPMSDYQQGYGHGESMSRQTPHSNYVPQHLAPGAPAVLDSVDSPSSLHPPASENGSSIHQLTQRINTQNQNIEDLKNANKMLTSRVDALEETLEQLKSQSTKPKKTKEGSNNHLALKPFVHPMFGELCRINISSIPKRKLSSILANTVHPLPDGKPYKTAVDGRQIWHPNFLGHVDNELNTKIISEVVQRVFDNETKSRAAANSKGNIPDEDFQIKFIQTSAKIYFRNIHTKAQIHADPVKAQLEDEKLVRDRQHTRCATVAKNRRNAALDYQGESGHNDAIGMIDTEFGSDLLSYESDNLSEDDKRRRQSAGVGKTAPMAVGREWRSLDYIAFLRWLSLRSQRKVAGNQEEPVPITSQAETPASGGGQPPKKCRKALKCIKVTKMAFDTAPHKMHDDAPRSMKGTRPFKHMVSEVEPELLPGADWLNGFFSRLGNSDLLVEDMTYLKEVVEWRKNSVIPGAVADASSLGEKVDDVVVEATGEK
ncbi:hypothetical protein JVT61DRAFT_13322 [Boletus reticuloceps]|uniref:Uncharacterized protein n=1 Tax=Boletus reticuloceps TaxID=495285 RepID=A0A8I2YDF0_9AGAM|nr:hypothetical protein JVT61DRAFT_13322 [Boletus reticuloceps]